MRVSVQCERVRRAGDVGEVVGVRSGVVRILFPMGQNTNLEAQQSWPTTKTAGAPTELTTRGRTYLPSTTRAFWPLVAGRPST